MTVTVFQVDPEPDLEPFTMERAELARLGANLVSGNCTTEDEVIARAGDAEILWLSWQPLVTSRVMEALPHFRLVVRNGVGYDQIPIRDATELGIAVTNAPAYGSEDVAEHAIALLLATARHVAWFHHRMVGGENPAASDYPIHRLVGNTLGVVGVGRIGSAVARRGTGLGLRVIGYDAFRPAKEIEALGIGPRGLDELLAEADFVSLHVQLTEETRGLINAHRLSRMRPGAILVNTSRGPVVDEPALIEALRERTIRAAALDVFSHEPLAVDSPLRSLDNVVLTPHAAGFSMEAMDDLRADLCNTVAEWIRDGWSVRVVNPEVRSRLRQPIA